MVCALHQSTASSSSSSSSYSPGAAASTTRQNISSRKSSSSSSSSKPGVLVLLSQFQRFPLLLVFWTVCLFNCNSYNSNNNNNLVVDAFLVLSRHKTTMSTDAIRDAGSGKVLTAGVIFRDEHAEITAAGQADTQCITSIGDIRGFDRNVHESPQYCVHVRNYDDNNDNDDESTSTTSSEYENFAVVAGVAGKQPALYRMPYKGAYDEAPLMEPFYLPTDTFPVDIKTDSSDGSVYVGLHDTFGTLVGEWNKPLEDVLNYFESVTVPNKARVISPKVMKADMMASIRSDENNNNNNNAVVWQTELTTTSGQSLIGGMAHVPSKNVVVVAGSSDGTGPMVGGDSNTNDNDDSWDGYVTVLDADTGNDRGSVRIQSDNQQDDFIHGVCALGDEIFIVGSTNGGIFADNEDGGGGGDGGGGAFVMKLNVDTLEIVWTKQFVGIGVTAIECQVTVSSLFVAGHVPAGVLMEQDDSRTTSATTTTTTQDLMVLAMDPSTSEVFWVRQIDSRRDDRLSNIMVAINGDLYIMANALDFADESNDVYLLTVTRQGGIHDWLGLPEDADPIDGHRSSGTTTIDDVEEDGIDPEDDKTDKTKIIIIAVAVPVFLLLLVVIYGVATSAKGDPNQRTADDTGAVENGVYKHSTMTAEPSTADVNFT